jgi:N-acetylmuramic acid 6-phosphate etherase
MTTERRNPRSVDIDLFPTERVLRIINAEDATIAAAVSAVIPEIAKTVDAAVEAIRAGGRLIYVGSGSSGRIAMLDAAECPPTFSAPPEWVQAMVAGGMRAMGQALESYEDDRSKGAADLKARKVSEKDFIIGIAASGKTPYTLAALEHAQSKGARTAAIVAAQDSPMAKVANILIYTNVGPEVIAGSTRMKAGTAQKVALNTISTGVMIKLGFVYKGLMVEMRPTNAKLRERAARMVAELTGADIDTCRKTLAVADYAIPLATVMLLRSLDRAAAQAALDRAGGNLRKALA